jgi:hypothetical protein
MCNLLMWFFNTIFVYELLKYNSKRIEYCPGYNKGTCTPMFNEALLTLSKLWKQLRSPTTDEWIKQMLYLYIVEFYSALKKNEISLFTGKWMKTENMILSEISQVQKAKGHMLSGICEIYPMQIQVISYI